MGAGGGFWWNTEEFAEVMGYIILVGGFPDHLQVSRGVPRQVSRGTWQVHYRVHVLMLINVNSGPLVVGGVYIQKARDPGLYTPTISLGFSPNFRLRTRNSLGLQVLSKCHRKNAISEFITFSWFAHFYRRIWHIFPAIFWTKKQSWPIFGF